MAYQGGLQERVQEWRRRGCIDTDMGDIFTTSRVACLLSSSSLLLIGRGSQRLSDLSGRQELIPAAAAAAKRNLGYHGQIFLSIADSAIL